ncbi:MAG: hypothetical protein LBD23_12635 [Oscillospiraceae bacterium]|jgi:hypothetical protein|nr:hypothetical protein [Oscillospiraceae bacterium]
MNIYVTQVAFSGLHSVNTQDNNQLTSRPKIDDVICHGLDGESLKEALFIIDNIRENKMKIKWTAINTWSVQYKRKHVCDLSLDSNNLHIGPVSEVLATRVKNMPHDTESMKSLIEALRDSISGTQEPTLAMS